MDFVINTLKNTRIQRRFNVGLNFTIREKISIMDMNDENISQLGDELDKLLEFVPTGSTFTSDWLNQEYKGVMTMRASGKPSYRNEYRIIKVLMEARTDVLLKNRNKMELFVPVSKIMKSIEDSLKEIFNNRITAKSINAELEKLMNQ